MFLSLALLLAATAHDNSQSSSRLTVDGAEVRLELRCQALSLFEVVPGLDANDDMLLVESELEARREAVLAYTSEHYRVVHDGEPLEARPLQVELARPDPRTIFPEPQHVDLVFELGVAADGETRAPPPFERLEIEVTLFHDTSPDHRDFAQVLWNDDPPVGLVLDRRRPRAVLPLPADAGRPRNVPPTLRRGALDFLRLGVEHILTGWDHLAFLLALLLAARGVRSLVAVVTAFTLAHSVTLALASLGLVHVPGTLVEITIALSIAYVGADTFFYPEPRAKWPEAFLFGLVHGLGFAGFLSESLLAASSRTWALVAFNLGVELGQVGVVLAVVLALRAGQRLGLPRPAAGEGLLPRPGRRAASLLVCLAGLYWFVERAWL